jgi:hypothetical protein
VRDLVNAHLAGRSDHGNRLWLLVNAEIWYRMMILGRSRESLQAELSENTSTMAAPGAARARVVTSGLAASNSA